MVVSILALVSFIGQAIIFVGVEAVFTLLASVSDDVRRIEQLLMACDAGVHYSTSVMRAHCASEC